MPGSEETLLLQKLGSSSSWWRSGGEWGKQEKVAGVAPVETWGHPRGSSLFPQCVLRTLSLETFAERPGKQASFSKGGSIQR